MDERDLRTMIDEVKSGRLSRRRFVQTMIGLGLTAPLASQMLTSAGVAQAQSKLTYKPTKRGGGGALKMLWWQGATLLNPHFATGTKDQDGSRIFYEPLASWDPDGNLAPDPGRRDPHRAERRGSPRTARSVTWKLKKGVVWHDGKPFTADDCVFTWEYCADPATASVTIGHLQGRQGREGRQPHGQGHLRQAHAVLGRRLRGRARHDHPQAPVRAPSRATSRARRRPTSSRSAPAPTSFVDFKPGDIVRGELNPSYHMPNRPYFDTIEMKGGGDAVSAARAVIQTGEFDYAWNMQVEDEILKRMEQGGKGKADIVAGGNIEHIQCNFTDPMERGGR